MKRISTNQIKTIRRSFLKVRNRQNFIRIPFEVVSILFFILQLLNRIENENDVLKHIKNELNNMSIGDYLYQHHTYVFSQEYKVKMNALRDEPFMLAKYQHLEANLIGGYSIMAKRYDEIDWDNANDYIIK